MTVSTTFKKPIVIHYPYRFTVANLFGLPHVLDSVGTSFLGSIGENVSLVNVASRFPQCCSVRLYDSERDKVISHDAYVRHRKPEYDRYCEACAQKEISPPRIYDFSRGGYDWNDLVEAGICPAEEKYDDSDFL